MYPEAVRLGADVIIQVGDFGYWEHTDEGVAFLDEVSEVATEHQIPLYWLHGNHDKHSLLLEKYGDKRTEDGFIEIRPGVFYIPQGHVWEWEETRFRAFGGAYSIDKEWRLEWEANRWRKLAEKENYRRKAGEAPRDVPSTVGTLWFPEEQMTDEEFAQLMAADSDPVDVIFSHDKPRGADPLIPLKNEPECWPNQDRLQRALVTHKPDFWIHGHLHHSYASMVRCGDDDQWTKVVGLAPDDEAAHRFWRAWQSWCLLDFGWGAPITLTTGAEARDD